MSYKVLLLDNVDPVCEQTFKERGIEAVVASKLSEEELLAEIPSYDGIVVRSGTTVNETVLKAATNLKVVGRAGVGVDNIDIDAATKEGVLVMNTPDGNTISTAEHTCGMILALARNIPVAVSKVKSGGWDRKKYMGTELHGKKLGIIGLGKIGSEVAERMQVFGMELYAYDPFSTKERAAELGVELLELDELLGAVDFLTIHTPLTEKTKGLISLEHADKLKDGIRLVNCARGGIIEEGDMKELIDSGKVAGIAVDVYTQEPPTEEVYEILKHPSIVSTPHLGASTEEAQEKVASQIANQMADALEKKNYKGSLNGKSIMLAADSEIQPYLELAEKLGKLAIQLAPKHSSHFSFEYSGACADNSQVLSDSILKGMLSGYVEESVNLINARFLAQERGFKIQETMTSESKTFSDLVTVRFPEAEDYQTVSATVFGEGDYRIVDINGFGIELSLEGELFIYQNVDKPGMLAAVSSSLAKEQINIASLSLGRSGQGSEAITAVVLDRPLNDEEIGMIDAIDGINKLRYVSLDG